MIIHAIIFFDSKSREPLDHRVYTGGKYISEYVEFGSKTLIRKMDFSNPEFVIELAGGEYVVYVTIIEDNRNDGIGCALLISKPPSQLNNLPHLVSRRFITEYIFDSTIPDVEEIYRCFKHKELIDQIAETKKVLTRTVSKVLERGEKIEELVEKTEHLSEASKMFFQNSRKMNSCWGCFSRPSWWP